MLQTTPHKFPSYSTAELQADYSVHGVGLTVAPVASVWLLFHAFEPPVTMSLAIYCLGLIAMLFVSALYNILPPIPAKEIMRRVDHAVIFVMIAGTYTPFVVNRLPAFYGISIGVYVWFVAASGVALALVYPHKYSRLKLALYLFLGWTIVLVIAPFAASIEQTTLLLLLAGGLVYSIGAGVHALQRPQFHNAIWHALVLFAAGLHFAAMTEEFMK